MTPEQCASIMEHLPVVKACGEGKPVYFASFDCDGKFIAWRSTNKVSLNSLCAGFYSMEEAEHAIASLYSVLESLWKARTKIAKLEGK